MIRHFIYISLVSIFCLDRSLNCPYFTHCRGNTGPPLGVQFVPSIQLIRTHFFNNHNQAPAPMDDNSTSIQSVFNSITTGGGFTYFTTDTEVSIVIEGCRFINNTGNSNENSTRPTLLSSNGHGGGVLIRVAFVTRGSIVIRNSVFEGNTVEVEGGAIYFSFGIISSSLVYLFNNTFRFNTAVMSHGGAVSWNLFDPSFNNTFVLEDCSFAHNSASSSGAVSIVHYETSLDSFLQPDKARFVRCHFEGNMARVESTAVGLFALVSVEEFGFPVEFIDW